MNRRTFFAKLERPLKELGYQRLAGSFFSGTRVFFKIVDGLVLELGVQTSNFYDERYTGNFYLSRTFAYAYLVEGFPQESYRRIGNFLTDDERTRFLDDEFCEPGVVDAWWDGFSDETLDKFLEAVAVAEPRFLAQSELFERVRSCKELDEYMEILHATETRVSDMNSRPKKLKHQPKRYQKGIQEVWYWAAEDVLWELDSEAVSKDYVDLVAVDAWRLSNLLP